MPDAEPEPADDLAAIDGEVLEGGDGDGDRRLVATRGEFSGPLPLPKMLGEYDDVQPGLGKIIVDQWQAETRHRHETIDDLRLLDREAMHGYYSGEKRGQLLGFAAFTIIAAVAIVAILNDNVEATLGSLFVAGAYAVWAFRRRSLAPEPSHADDDLSPTPSDEP